MKQPLWMVLHGVVLATLLGACDPTPPLTAAQRAKVLLEAVEDRPDCAALRERLRDPAITLEGFNAAYRESISSKCLLRHA